MQRRLLRAHLGVAVVAVLAMLGASALWVALTPRQQWIVYPQTADVPQGQALSLPLESYFRFTSIAFFTLGALIVGIVLAVAAWQIRFARGTPMVLVLIGALAAGSALGLLIGHLVRGGVDPAVLAASGVDAPTLVQMPASISRWAIVIAPGIAAVVYTLTAAWHSDPDLGRPQVRIASAGALAAFDHASDPITAPIPAVVGGPPSPAPGTFPAPGTSPAVGAAPVVGTSPTVGTWPGPRPADGFHPGAASGPGGFGVTPGDGTPRTDP